MMAACYIHVNMTNSLSAPYGKEETKRTCQHLDSIFFFFQEMSLSKWEIAV